MASWSRTLCRTCHPKLLHCLDTRTTYYCARNQANVRSRGSLLIFPINNSRERSMSVKITTSTKNNEKLWNWRHVAVFFLFIRERRLYRRSTIRIREVGAYGRENNGNEKCSKSLTNDNHEPVCSNTPLNNCTVKHTALLSLHVSVEVRARSYATCAMSVLYRVSYGILG